MWPIFEKADVLIGYNSTTPLDIPILNKYYPGRFVSHKIHRPDDRGAKGTWSAFTSSITRGSNARPRQRRRWTQSYLRWWAQGLVDKVREYCIEDVRITRELFDYALKHRVLKYKDLRDIRDIKIDTSQWKIPKEPPSMTHTSSLLGAIVLVVGHFQGEGYERPYDSRPPRQWDGTKGRGTAFRALSASFVDSARVLHC